MAPKRHPKRAKVEDKNEDKKEASEDRLGAVWGLSWIDLGIHIGSNSCVFPLGFTLFFENQLF